MRKLTIVALLLSLISMPVIAQTTFDDIEKAVTAQWDKLQSLSGVYDLTATFKLNPDQPTPMKLVGGGTVDYAKAAGTPRYKGFLWAGFSPTGRLLQAQGLYDGQIGYYEALAPLLKLNESGQATMAEVIQPGGKPLFDAMRKHLTNLGPLPDEQIGGVDCYAVKASPKDPESPVAAFKACFAKATGMLHRVTLVDAAGAEMAVATMRDVKVDGEIAGDVFKFVSLAPPAPAPAPAVPAPAPQPAPQN